MSLTTAGILSDRNRRRAAWVAPVVVAGAVVAGLTLTGGSASGAIPDLPSKTPVQLLTAVQRNTATAFSGVVKETANLGIPSLPGSDHGGASLSWQTFITGSHSARVWADGPARQRIALLGELSEADVIHNGPNVWTYTSDTNTVTHTILSRRTHGRADVPDARELTPAAAAARVLKAVSPSTAVSVDTARMVADRPAYTLVLRPRDARSTVSRVTIAIDAHRYVPLRVQVFGNGSAPAFETGFTSISFATPKASTFGFHAPAGAKTSTNPFGSAERRGEHADRHITKPAGPAHHSSQPRVIGSGWTSVLELPADAAGGGALNNLPRGSTSAVGTSGGHLLHTALVNVIFLPDGRTFVGAVSPTYLEHVAASTPH